MNVLVTVPSGLIVTWKDIWKSNVLPLVPVPCAENVKPNSLAPFVVKCAVPPNHAVKCPVKVTPLVETRTKLAEIVPVVCIPPLESVTLCITPLLVVVSAPPGIIEPSGQRIGVTVIVDVKS